MISFHLKICTLFVIFLINVVMINGQRPSYAGSRPQSGYKDKFKPGQNETTQQNDLSNRFTDELLTNQTQRPPVFIPVVQPDESFTPLLSDRVDSIAPVASLNNTNINQVPLSNTENSTRLPYDALGDKDLVDRLNRLPIDQRPFWLINAQAIEAHRNRVAPAGTTNQAILLNQQQQAVVVNQQQQQQLGTPSDQQLGTISVSNSSGIINPTGNLQNPVGPNLSQLRGNPLQRSLLKALLGPNSGAVAQASIGEKVSGESLIDDEPASEPGPTVPPNKAGFPNYGVLKE